MKINIDAEEIVDELGGEILNTKAKELVFEEHNDTTIMFTAGHHIYLVKREEFLRAFPLLMPKDSIRLNFASCKD